MSPLFLALIGVAVVSLTSLGGVAALVFKKDTLNKVLIFFVSFSAGSLIGGAFFHLLAENLETDFNILYTFVFVVIGFILFFGLEKILHWRHCHDNDCVEHQHLGWMNLVGDAIHNFIDGMVIFAAFQVGPHLGIPVTISVFLHEIPQELSDFCISIYAGFTKIKALVLNLACTLTSFLGVLAAYFLIDWSHSLENFLLPFAAGGFIYIAATDLVPEMHKEKKTSRSFLTFAVFLLALVFMFLIKFFGGA